MACVLGWSRRPFYKRAVLLSLLIDLCDMPTFPILNDGFHSDVIKLQSQKSEVLRILIYSMLKTNRKYIFVQVSSPEACFISKI